MIHTYITFLFLAFIAILIIFFVKKYKNYILNNKKFLGKLMIRNILVYTGLIILTGLIASLYVIFSKGRYSGGIPYDSIVGIFIIFILLFLNLLGYIQAILSIEKIHILIINHVLFIVSTILVFILARYCVNILTEKGIMTKYSMIVFIGTVIIMENIISYAIVKIYLKNRIRSNGT